MKYFFTLIIFGTFFSMNAQMNNVKLEEQLTEKLDSITGEPGRWQGLYNESLVIILTDETNDRMRIITPIIETSKLDEGLLLDCLTANFHSALDVKYAISDNVLWSVYVHPLSPLTYEELDSAVDQVYAAAVTFGTTFSSTPLLFGGSQGEGEQQEIKKEPSFKKT